MSLVRAHSHPLDPIGCLCGSDQSSRLNNFYNRYQQRISTFDQKVLESTDSVPGFSTFRKYGNDLCPRLNKFYNGCQKRISTFRPKVLGKYWNQYLICRILMVVYIVWIFSRNIRLEQNLIWRLVLDLVILTPHLLVPPLSPMTPVDPRIIHHRFCLLKGYNLS